MKRHRLLIFLTLSILMGCAAPPTLPLPPSPTPSPSRTPSPALSNSHTPPPFPSPPADPFALISQESLLAFIGDLTAIQSYSGWRTSATQGECEAFDYIAAQLGDLELERQSFRVFATTELWETGLYLKMAGQSGESEVLADGLRGHRDDLSLALRLDSDGQANDVERNPVEAEGPAVIIRSADEIAALRRGGLKGKIAFLDYAVVDVVTRRRSEATALAADLLAREPAGVVLVTQFSNRIGESHGAFVADTGAFVNVESGPVTPILYVRLEDLAAADIHGWDDLARIEAARLVWDADLLAPATSGNLIARIPGADPRRAVILGAHVDSPNGPGAMDDGGGVAILLETARVLAATGTRPPVDLYLVWFGSEELGLYGAYHFAATHAELLDRAMAMLQVDCLTRPLDGLRAELTLVTWSYARLGDNRLLWPDHLRRAAERRGIETVTLDSYHFFSDNNALGALDVPHATLIYLDQSGMEAAGGIHYAGHIHDPYDTVELAREMGDVLEEMARVALTAALDAPRSAPNLRVSPRPTRRALFIASHTETAHMTPGNFPELGMAMAQAGFDVDVIPYGQPVTPADLSDAALVVALPVIDYPADDAPYDETWSESEIAALEAYVAEGGLLVLTNSAYRLKYNNRRLDANEDWGDVNALAERFGVTYRAGTLAGDSAAPQGNHPLLAGVDALALAEGNGVPFSVENGRILARAGRSSAVALINYGERGGQVLALADLGILGGDGGSPVNLQFWRNLARYTQAR